MTLKAEQIRGRGVRLKDAWLSFAPDEQRCRYVEPFRLTPSGDALSTGGPGETVFALLSILAGPSREAVHKQQREELRAALRHDLCSRLEGGGLIGFGHQSTPVQTRKHRKIPVDFWIGVQIDWDAEVAADASRVFHKVLILDPTGIPELLPKPSTIVPLSTREIDRAIGELISENRNFKSEIVGKVKVHLIRERVKWNNPEVNTEGSGFHDDTIRKRLAAFTPNKD